MNPYDFVRFPERVRRTSVQTHHALHGHQGMIHCRLTAITPLFIPSTQVGRGGQQFLTKRVHGRDIPIIPGSSLKGAIRSVAEAVSSSCIGLSGELFDRNRVSATYQGKLPEELATCTNILRLCPACRLFGMVSNQGHFLGKVSPSDATTEAGQFQVGSPIILRPLMEPKPRHQAFYLPGGKVAGRKFYFHHAGLPKITTQATSFTKTIVPLEGLDAHAQPRTVFEFDVHFTNLTEDEYTLLLFALVLTDTMRHKVGGGKPHGLGTVRIEATSLHLHPPTQRYTGLASRVSDTSVGTIMTDVPLQLHLQEHLTSFLLSPSPSVRDLQRIWQYPPATDAQGKPIDYHYPDQTWFRTHSNVPISGTP
jgi:CRISPR/Cas system CSM-associated protein Csm3 (group 7 of RAMP superfamily)